MHVNHWVHHDVKQNLTSMWFFCSPMCVLHGWLNENILQLGAMPWLYQYMYRQIIWSAVMNNCLLECHQLINSTYNDKKWFEILSTYVRSIGLYTRVNHMQNSLKENTNHIVSSSTKIIDCRFLQRYLPA